MSLKLHTYPNNPRANKALIAAKYAGVENIELIPVEMGKSNKTEEFLALNPFGKIPTLETPEGGIFESNAIARFVARQTENTLFGSSAFESGQVEQWIDWVRGDLELAGSVWLYPIFGIIPNHPQATARAKEDIKSLLSVLDSHLESRTYLVGKDVTLADVVVCCTLVPLYTKVFDATFRDAFPHVTNWFVTLVSLPNFRAVQGEIALCDVMAVAEQKVETKAEAPAAVEEAETEDNVEENSQIDEEVQEEIVEAVDEEND